MPVCLGTALTRPASGDSFLNRCGHSQDQAKPIWTKKTTRQLLRKQNSPRHRASRAKFGNRITSIAGEGSSIDAVQNDLLHTVHGNWPAPNSPFDGVRRSPPTRDGARFTALIVGPPAAKTGGLGEVDDTRSIPKIADAGAVRMRTTKNDAAIGKRGPATLAGDESTPLGRRPAGGLSIPSPPTRPETTLRPEHLGGG
jgi:hypothetical protein